MKSHNVDEQRNLLTDIDITVTPSQKHCLDHMIIQCLHREMLAARNVGFISTLVNVYVDLLVFNLL